MRNSLVGRYRLALVLGACASVVAVLASSPAQDALTTDGLHYRSWYQIANSDSGR